MSGLDIKHDGMKWEKDLVKVELPKLPESTNNDRGTTIKFKTQVNFNTNLYLKPEYSVLELEKTHRDFMRYQKETNL